MSLIRLILIVVTLFGITACSSKFKNYDGPEITSVQVHKERRRLYLLAKGEVIATYKVRLGGNPVGHKEIEGDQKTPEGAYYITHKNPKSEYHLSLGISYPNAKDRAHAATLGKNPGGDIFIHGGPNVKVTAKDWTAGCIAVTDAQMEDIYAMVKPGTPIYIFP